MNKKQERLVPGSISRVTLDFLVGELRRELKQNLIDEINFKQDLEFLKDNLKYEEEYESEVSLIQTEAWFSLCFNVFFC